MGYWDKTGTPKFMGTIRNAYKFVVGQLSHLEVKGIKTAVKQHSVKEYIGFNDQPHDLVVRVSAY